MIDFWGVGYRVAKRMGIEQQIRAAGYDVESSGLSVREGDTEADLDVDVFRRMIGDTDQPAARDLAAAIYPTSTDGRSHLRRQHRHPRRARRVSSTSRSRTTSPA